MDPNFDLLHVEQEVEGSDESALSSVLGADIYRVKLLAEKSDIEAILQKSEDLPEEEMKQKTKRLEFVYNELRNIRADSAPARAAKILFGLQFDSEMQGRATREFSGNFIFSSILSRKENLYFFLQVVGE